MTADVMGRQGRALRGVAIILMAFALLRLGLIVWGSVAGHRAFDDGPALVAFAADGLMVVNAVAAAAFAAWPRSRRVGVAWALGALAVGAAVASFVVAALTESFAWDRSLQHVGAVVVAGLIAAFAVMLCGTAERR